MASSQDDEDWDMSTSEIQSEDSDELYESRPNRWKGSSQRWRFLTEDDRLTCNALDRLRNQNLSLHLYNAFALRQRLPPAAANANSSAEEDVDAETGCPVRTGPWAVPKSWTAWPLRAQLLPPDDFMKRTEDEDDVFTFRRSESQLPSSRLEEVVSATTLGFAKERFRRRGVTASALKDEGSQINSESLPSGNESLPSDSDHESGDETHNGQELEDRRRRRRKTPVTTLQPAVATDDDASYDLIRPSTRNILSKLDQTLTLLHNARMTSALNLLDSGSSSSEREDGHSANERPHLLPQSQQSSRSGSPADHSRAVPTLPTAEKKSNRGRPRKYVQMEGESEREYLIRRARALKARINLPPADGDGGGTATPGKGEISPRNHRLGRKRRRRDMTEDRLHWAYENIGRLNLRDWSEVMGAAALVGFSPKVIARATQRCADLFGQGMKMHQIKETAVSSGVTGVQTILYQPGEAMPPGFSESGEDDGDLDVRQARCLVRHCSTAPSTTDSSASDDEEDGQGASSKKSQKRGVSRRKGKLYCPFADCSRALEGFKRPFNLKRHMKLIHGQDALDGPENKEGGADHMDGGIHRDGFLEPISIQKGWRAQDTRKRATRQSRTNWQHDYDLGNGDDTGSEQDSDGGPVHEPEMEE